MDILSMIFERQKAFDDDLIARRQLSHITREEWLQKETLAIMDELSELMNEVNYKWWKNPKPLDEAAIKEELIDILHFWVSMCIKMGMDAKDVLEIYLEKNKENFDRQQGKSAKIGYESPAVQNSPSA